MRFSRGEGRPRAPDGNLQESREFLDPEQQPLKRVDIRKEGSREESGLNLGQRQEDQVFPTVPRSLPTKGCLAWCRLSSSGGELWMFTLNTPQGRSHGPDSEAAACCLVPG